MIIRGQDFCNALILQTGRISWPISWTIKANGRFSSSAGLSATCHLPTIAAQKRVPARVQVYRLPTRADYRRDTTPMSMSENS